jgi:serine/threonine-protein kinase
MILKPGLRISETIELRSLIGEGGMGQVWAAFHHSLRRDVAVKFLSGPLASDASALQRFTLEAQTIGRLQCPYVPQVFDFGTLPDGGPFIVMELLDGVDLQTRLETEGGLSLAQTEHLVGQMCMVLSLAHGLGLVHRDIKPSNIVLIRGEGDAFTAKLLDFGIVKALDFDSGTRTGTTLGTPSYMSPEQLMGAKRVDARADLWSLAVVAYCCLTGELPFAGETFGAVCLSIHGGPFVAPSSHRSGLPASLDEWFRRALNRAPDERFQSAAEMSAAFSATMPTVAVSIPPVAGPFGSGPESMAPSLVTLVVPPKRRTRWRGAVAAAAAFTVLGSLVVVARSSLEPGATAASDWSLAGRLSRAVAGALGKRATTFANGGPPLIPDAGSSAMASPEVDTSSPPPAPDVALPVAPSAESSVAKNALPRAEAPGAVRRRIHDSVSTRGAPGDSTGAAGDAAPAIDNPYP